ncbi:hypothetical protein F5H01DRAFT_354822 [Linnemannia elongata]|nr:hypothetical protein F5H01DRAFT_354822 [Linnemannia elongata]
MRIVGRKKKHLVPAVQLVLGILGVLAAVNKARVFVVIVQPTRTTIKVAIGKGTLAEDAGVNAGIAETPDREFLGFSLVGAHNDEEHGEGQGDEVGDLEGHLEWT